MYGSSDNSPSGSGTMSSKDLSGLSREDYMDLLIGLQIDIKERDKIIDTERESLSKVTAELDVYKKITKQDTDQQKHLNFMLSNRIKDLNEEIKSLKKSAEIQSKDRSGLESQIKQLTDQNNKLTAEIVLNIKSHQKTKQTNAKNKFEMERESQKLKKANIELKKSRDYYKKEMDFHKLKTLAVSHTAVRQKEVFTGAILDQFQVNTQMTVKAIDEAKRKSDQIFAVCVNEATKSHQQNLARTQARTETEVKQIKESERRMETKTADGKYPCGSCDKACDTSDGLKQHLTKKHKMHINYRQTPSRAHPCSNN